MKARSKARKRRGRGEGGVYERSPGLWRGQVSLGVDGNGKRRRVSVEGASKQEVLDEMDRLRGQARTGGLADAGALTVGQLLTRWLDASKARTETSTYETRQALVDNHLVPRIGGVKLARLTALHIEGLFAQLAEVGGWVPRQAADVLASALNHAVRLRILPANPMDSLDKPRAPKREMVCLSAAQAKVLLAAATARPCFAILALALGSGCRQGELLGLAWADLDLDRGTLTIRRALSQTRGKGILLKEPKTASSRRTLALPAFALDAMREYRKQQLAAGLIACPVFCTRTGGYLSKRNVLRSLKQVIRRANLPPGVALCKGGRGIKRPAADPSAPKVLPTNLRFHDLRHSHASILLSAGQSLRAVSQRLGHSNPALTLRVYAHCLPGDDGRLGEELQRQIG